MTWNVRAAFFDGIAERWDGWEDLDALHVKLTAGLAELGVGPDEFVVDVGCGTGNLTRALLERLSPRGRVAAVDISPRMVDIAKSKVADDRVDWHIADAVQLPLSDASCDRVMCCAVWPHFENPTAVVAEFARVLRTEGRLHVWHVIGRERVNEIHAAAGEAVRGDVLATASETGKLLSMLGFRVDAAFDTADRYLVSATRTAR